MEKAKDTFPSKLPKLLRTCALGVIALSLALLGGEACTKKSSNGSVQTVNANSSDDTDPPVKPKRKKPPSIMIWQDLSQMKPGMKKVPESVSKLIGKKIQVAGFAIINDVGSEDDVREFLLTPVPGGCVHVPPPPPNYLVRVSMAKGKKTPMPFGPVEVSGKLILPKNLKDRQFYSFEIIADLVEDYRTAHAREEKSADSTTQ